MSNDNSRDEWRDLYAPRKDDEGDPQRRRPSPTLERMKQQREQEERLAQRMALIKHKILVLSGKGGVGKTTVAANLGRALAARHFSVGLLDADIHGPNLPLLLGVEGQHAEASEMGIRPVVAGTNLIVMSVSLLTDDPSQPVVWRGPLKAALLRQFLSDVDWGPLDFLIVDNPPGTGDEPLTAAQSIPDPDGVLIVSLPQAVSLLDCRKAINFAHALGLPVLGLVENMSGFVCPHCGRSVDLFGSGGAERMARQLGVPFLARIPMAVGVQAMTDRGQSLVGEDAPAEVHQAFDTLVDNFLQQIGTSGG